MEFSHFFEMAEALKNRIIHNKEEICLRTAINRLHYGIFHAVITTFNIRFITQEEKKCCHEIVGKKIKDVFQDQALTNMYYSLEEWRNHADYDLSKPITASNYRNALELKDELISNITGSVAYIPPYDSNGD